MNSGSVSSIRIGRTAHVEHAEHQGDDEQQPPVAVERNPGTRRVAAHSAAALISRRQRISMSAAMRRQHAGADPSQDEFARGLVAPCAIDDRGAESAAADGVHESNRGAANRDRSDRDSANRQPQPDAAPPSANSSPSDPPPTVTRPSATPPNATTPTEMFPMATMPFAILGRIVSGSTPAHTWTSGQPPIDAEDLYW